MTPFTPMLVGSGSTGGGSATGAPASAMSTDSGAATPASAVLPSLVAPGAGAGTGTGATGGASSLGPSTSPVAGTDAPALAQLAAELENARATAQSRLAELSALQGKHVAAVKEVEQLRLKCLVRWVCTFATP